ncbi:MAG: glutamate-1-semialdehyde 2,1-aminomutase [Bacteroidota bacterium]
MKKRSFDRSLSLQPRFHRAIPGGAHTYAKGDDQFPEFCPPYMLRGKGCRVWDVDDNEYIEYGNGLRAVSLGHAYDPVIEAAYQQMKLGNNFSRPATLEMELAEAFLARVPGAEMVKFAKNGSDTTTAAIKLARAVSGRTKIAMCGDHPFFSVDDWFIGATAINRGIPQSQVQETLKFRFNDLQSAQQLFDQYPGEIACCILEPEKYDAVDPAFLKGLQTLCHQKGALFILDEMITGYRWHVGGMQTKLGITPDLSTFGKAMGNGFSIAALAGKREYMELGGLYHHEERVFLLSTTHGAELPAMAAAKAVLEEYDREQVIDYLAYQGERLRKGMLQIIEAHRLKRFMGVHGHPSCLVFSTRDENKKPSQAFRTLFMQEIIQRGMIAPNLVLSFSHRDADIDQTLEIVEEAAVVYRKALDEGVDKYLAGRSVAPVYRKLNFPADRISGKAVVKPNPTNERQRGQQSS